MSPFDEGEETIPQLEELCVCGLDVFCDGTCDYHRRHDEAISEAAAAEAAEEYERQHGHEQ